MYFSFSPAGIEGESVTTILPDGSARREKSNYREISFLCDKPFYALSLYQGLPLLALSVTDL